MENSRIKNLSARTVGDSLKRTVFSVQIWENQHVRLNVNAIYGRPGSEVSDTKVKFWRRAENVGEVKTKSGD